MLRSIKYGIWLFCSLTFQLNFHVFCTWRCVLLFAMNQPCSIILIKGSMKKLVSRLKWHYVFWQKRYVCICYLSFCLLCVKFLHYSQVYLIILIFRLVSRVSILCNHPWICWAITNVLPTVTIIGKNNLERCGSASLLLFIKIYLLPFIYFRKLGILKNSVGVPHWIVVWPI